jgi:hypothetical protein
MAGNGARRAAIAASFAVQAAVIAFLATDSAGGSVSAAVPVGPAPVQQGAAITSPPSVTPAIAPATSLPGLPPGVIPVLVSATGKAGGTAQYGDIGFPMPEDPPRLVIKPGTTITVEMTIPPDVQASGLWLGLADDQLTGAPRVKSRLLTVSRQLSPGRHAYTLRWTLAAGTPPGTAALLVMDVRHPAGEDLAPIAELVAG